MKRGNPEPFLFSGFDKNRETAVNGRDDDQNIGVMQ